MKLYWLNMSTFAILTPDQENKMLRFGWFKKESQLYFKGTEMEAIRIFEMSTGITYDHKSYDECYSGCYGCDYCQPLFDIQKVSSI